MKGTTKRSNPRFDPARQQRRYAPPSPAGQAARYYEEEKQDRASDIAGWQMRYPMSLIGGWTNLIYEVATGSWKAKVIFAPIVGVSYAGLIVGLFLLSRVVDRWLSLPKVFSYPWSLVVGFFLIAFGLALYCLSVAQFLRVRGTPVPFSPPPKLVTRGLYRFTRNPMMTGLFMQFFGIGIALGSLSLVFIFTPLFIGINVWELKKVEEPELERRLGEAYVKYKKEVPMFIPCRKR